MDSLLKRPATTGFNNHGQLGDNSQTTSFAPVRMATVWDNTVEVTAITVGGNHIVVLAGVSTSQEGFEEEFEIFGCVFDVEMFESSGKPCVKSANLQTCR